MHHPVSSTGARLRFRRRRALERPDAQVAALILGAAVQIQNEVDAPITEVAFAVEEHDRPALPGSRPSWLDVARVERPSLDVDTQRGRPTRVEQMNRC